MNHIYRSIWSKALGTWIAVSENTKSKSKCSGTRNALLATGLLVCSGNSLALPTGEQLTAGQVSISTAAGQMQIDQTSQRAIVNWQGFSIAPNEVVNIQQPNAQAALLNRVVGQDASQIQGQLNANGLVYLVNPNGVLFGKTAQVDVGGLVASTHNMQNADFLNGVQHFTQDNATGTVSNQGIIKTPDGGIVALIGNQVSNDGTITTPKGTTALAAGKTVDLDFQGDGLVAVKVSEAALNAQIANKGAIQADGGRVVLTAQAAGQLIDTVINQDGIIRAQGLTQRNGEIILDAGNAGVTQINGTLDADGQQGGKISIMGKQIQINNGAIVTASGDNGGGAIVIGDKQNTNQTTVQETASISVQSKNQGDAGRIEIFANMDNGTVNLAGQLNASAPTQGNGGFIDTSAAHVKIADTAKVSTKAATGKTGNWLIDPPDFTIAASGGDMTGSTLGNILASTSMTIVSSSGANGVNGDINVNDIVTWSANLLLLNAQHNININANLDGSGTAQLALVYGQGGAGGDYFINNGAKVNLPAGANFSTQNSVNAAINYTVITSLGAVNSFTAADLQGMQGNFAGNYVLGADIDASATSTWNGGQGFSPIGFTGCISTGNFDGLGHTITGLYINRPNTNNVGLFGISDTGNIRNVGLVGGTIVGSNNVGSLAGSSSNQTISNVYSTANVQGNSNVGGLIGQSGSSSINNAYATGSVTGTGSVGGLVGFNSGNINNAYATGSVTGTSSVGGLVGFNAGIGSGSISNTYATGRVTGSTGSVGGLIGFNCISSISNSFWNTETTGQVNGVASNFGGTLNNVLGKTTAEMSQLATFTGWNIANTAGSSAVWRIYEGYSAPLLRSFLVPLTISADNISKTYNGLNDSSLTNLIYSIANANLSGHLFNASVTAYLNAINAGTYTPTALYYSDQQGYDISPLVNGILTINKAPLIITANDFSKIFDGLAFTGGNGVSYSGFVNNEDSSYLTGILDYGGDSQGAINTGFYFITPFGLSSSNYDISYGNGLLSINNNQTTTTTQAFTNEALNENTAGLVSSFMEDSPITESLSNESSTSSITESGLTVQDTADDNHGSPKEDFRLFRYILGQDNIQKAIVPTLTVKNSAGRVMRLQLSANKQFLSLLLEDGSVRVWDFERGVQRNIIDPNKKQNLTDISTVNDKGELVSVASTRGIGAYDIIGSLLDDKLAINEPDIKHFIISNDGNLLLVNLGDGHLGLWDSKHNKELWRLPYKRGVVNNLTLSDDKRYAAVLSRQQGVYVYEQSAGKVQSLTDALDIIDLATGKTVKSLPNFGEDVIYNRFKDNDTLLVGLASGKLLDWSIATNSPKTVANFSETVVTLDHDKQTYAYIAKNGTVHISNGQGDIQLSIQNPNNPITDAKLLADGKKLLTVLANGDLALWDIATGKKILRLFSTKQGWTVMDAFGRFDGSDEAMENFSWIANEEEIPLDGFSENYYEPGLLASALQNQDFQNSNLDKVKDGISLPPKVALQLADQQTNGDKVTVKLDVYDRGGGIDKVQIYHNGKLISNENTITTQQSLQENNREHRVLTLNITPNAGANTLKVVASNTMGIENNSSEISFDGKTKAYASSMRLMTVGINNYQESQLNLNYSVPDAELINKVMKNNAKLIASTSLLNENATKAKILAELKELSQGTQQDVLVIYFAGHGVAFGKEWYFLPYETKLESSLEKIVKAGISASELSDIFKNSKIQHILLMVDSCHSGAGMNAFSATQNGQRYFSRQLSRSLGITVVAAAAKDQQAAELKSLGHGLFTYLLTQELEKKDDSKPMTAHSIAESILKSLPAFSKKTLGTVQEPVIYTKGNDFMLTDVLKDKNIAIKK